MIKHLLFAPIFLFSVAVSGETLNGKAVRFLDGDTLVLLGDKNVRYRIRLLEIDAPENGQPFGKKSKEALTKLCAGKPVRVEISSTDRYGRTPGTVYCDGTGVNLEMVRMGLAWFYVQYGTRHDIRQTEAEAKTAKRGLWFDKNPIAPWKWRRGERGVKDSFMVKKSKSGICHDSSSKWYGRTKRYTEFKTLDACLRSGGRLPKS